MSDKTLPEIPCALSQEQARMLIHELRSPMTAIAGYADLLRHHELPPEELGPALDAISHAVERMDAMLDAVATGKPFERPELAVRKPVSLRELADRAAADTHAAHWRQVAVEASCDPVVTGDPLLLRRAVDNLLGNAVKYSSGAIRVRVSAVKGFGRLEVCDHGPGIPVAEMEHVFERFARLDRDAASPGMGLGLAVVRDIAEAHGGRAWAEPIDGFGACVLVEIPLAG